MEKVKPSKELKRYMATKDTPTKKLKAVKEEE